MSVDNLPAVFQNGGALANRFQGMAANNSDLSEGVGGGFGVVSIKASKFRIKYKGEEFPITNEDGDPVPSLEVVIVKANPHITKQWYAAGYVDGATAAPDCWSLDGKRPDPQAPKPQCQSCAACPHNQFGSRITENGKKAKACSDTRRIAVVPLNDMHNESFGGPMLFRVPPSALKGLQQYADLLQRRGYPYFSVATRIGFDIDASHPLPIFKPIRPLTDDEAGAVLELMEDDRTARVLADFEADASGAKPAQDDDEDEETFSQALPAGGAPAAAVAAAAAAPAPKAATKPAPAAQAAKPAAAPKPAVVKPAAAAVAPRPAVAPKPAKPTPVPSQEPEAELAAEPEGGGDLDSDIASILANLNAVPVEA